MNGEAKLAPGFDHHHVERRPYHYNTNNNIGEVTSTRARAVAGDAAMSLAVQQVPTAGDERMSSSTSSVSSPPSAAKSVSFELLFTESPHQRARLPLRVQIYAHDSTDSIVTTVKNFYGLYSSPTTSKGVSFEDEQGHTLIARYENFSDNMVVYVRVIDEPASPHGPGSYGPPASNYAAHQHLPTYPAIAVGGQAYYGDEADRNGNGGGQMQNNGHNHPQVPAVNGHGHHGHHNAHLLQPPPQQQAGQHISRPTSRTSRKRSLSPGGRGRRSASASTNPAAGGSSKNGRSRSVKKRSATGGSQSNGNGVESDSFNAGYSSGDNAPGSASGKKEHIIGNTEISVDNIVEGGRRKRAKFESSVSGPLALEAEYSSLVICRIGS